MPLSASILSSLLTILGGQCVEELRYRSRIAFHNAWYWRAKRESLSGEDNMSLSWSRSAAEIKLGEPVRRLRITVRSPPRHQAVLEPRRTNAEPMQRLDIRPRGPNEAELATERGSAGWKLKFSALGLGGVVMIGALVDLAQAPPDNMSSVGAFAPAAAGAVQPQTSGETPMVTVNSPIVAALIAASQPTPQYPDPKPVAAISVRPDGTPIATSPPSATDSVKAAQTSDGAKPAAKPSPDASNETAGSAQPSTPKPDSPKKRSEKFSNRVVVARFDAPAPAAAPETLGPPLQLGTSEGTENAAGAAPRAAADSPAPAEQRADLSAATVSGGWAVQLAAPKSETEAKSDAAWRSA